MADFCFCGNDMLQGRVRFKRADLLDPDRSCTIFYGIDDAGNVIPSRMWNTNGDSVVEADECSSAEDGFQYPMFRLIATRTSIQLTIIPSRWAEDVGETPAGSAVVFFDYDKFASPGSTLDLCNTSHFLDYDAERSWGFGCGDGADGPDVPATVMVVPIALHCREEAQECDPCPHIRCYEASVVPGTEWSGTLPPVASCHEQECLGYYFDVQTLHRTGNCTFETLDRAPLLTEKDDEDLPYFCCGEQFDSGPRWYLTLPYSPGTKAYLRARFQYVAGTPGSPEIRWGMATYSSDIGKELLNCVPGEPRTYAREHVDPPSHFHLFPEGIAVRPTADGDCAPESSAEDGECACLVTNEYVVPVHLRLKEPYTDAQAKCLYRSGDYVTVAATDNRFDPRIKNYCRWSQGPGTLTRDITNFCDPVPGLNEQQDFAVWVDLYIRRKGVTSGPAAFVGIFAGELSATAWQYALNYAAYYETDSFDCDEGGTFHRVSLNGCTGCLFDDTIVVEKA